MTAQTWQTARLILIGGSLIIAISLGVRHSFGLFLEPVSSAHGWGRETFGLAMALQNLVWGLAQPFTGMASDRYGAGRIIVIGALFYIAGLISMTLPLGETGYPFITGILLGIGLSGTTFPIVFGAISRALPEDKRSLGMGIAMAVGSFGQFVMLPVTLGLIQGFGWSQALIGISAIAAVILPLSFLLNERRDRSAAPAVGPSAGEAFRDAMRLKDFWLLFLGFFVCGFQVVLIATHLPAFLADQGLQTSVPTIVLALIGLFNIAGSYLAGLWGGRYDKPRMLTWLYLLRGLVIAIFIYTPISPTSAYLFGAVMGLFWLSTVPLTNGVVASMFGVKNLSMLGGIVFLSHQLGSFLGGWLGGLFYDRFGNYDAVWAMAIGLSLIAAILHVPIREKPFAVTRPARA